VAKIREIGERCQTLIFLKATSIGKELNGKQIEKWLR